MLIGLIGFVILLGIWLLVVMLLKPSPVVLPSPLETLNGFIGMVQTREVWSDVGISLFRVISGYLIAAVMGMLVGLLLARSTLFRRTVQPTLEGLRFVIPFAWIPIASFWFGLSEAGKIFITWYAAFFIIAFQTEMGFRHIDVRLLKAAQTLGAGPQALLWRVYFPAAAPAIVTGLRLGLAFAWISILAAELVNSKSGIGYFTMNAADLFNTDLVLSAMIIIGMIGFCMDRGFRMIEVKMFSWYRSDDAIQ